MDHINRKTLLVELPLLALILLVRWKLKFRGLTFAMGLSEALILAAVLKRMPLLQLLFHDLIAAVKGYPCSHGTGVAVSVEQYSMGICSYSPCPEGAWDFLEYFVEASWTEREFYVEGELIRKRFSNYFAGFPVNRQLFERMLAQSMVQQYNPATREPHPLLQGEGEVPDFYANTAKDVQMLREVIALADRRALSDQSVICQILREEIGGYNAGALTAEQTAEKIQNRVQLYLDERE